MALTSWTDRQSQNLKPGRQYKKNRQISITARQKHGLNLARRLSLIQNRNHVSNHVVLNQAWLNVVQRGLTPLLASQTRKRISNEYMFQFRLLQFNRSRRLFHLQLRANQSLLSNLRRRAKQFRRGQTIPKEFQTILETIPQTIRKQFQHARIERKMRRLRASQNRNRKTR